MTLANTVLLPETVMPLYIFEVRYRRMLADALAGERMFAILNAPRGKTKGGEANEAQFCPIATVGLIRMSSLNSDGTSTVMLQGAARVRVLGISQEKPYRIVRIEPLPDETIDLPADWDRTKHDEMLHIIEQILPGSEPTAKDFLQACRTISGAEALSSFAMQTLCNDASFRQRFLETTNRKDRVQQTIRSLNETLAEVRIRREIEGHLPSSDDYGN